MDPAGILLQTALFGDLTREDVESLLPDLNTRRYRRGEVVWLAGDPAEELFILAEGQLKSSLTNADGREVIVRVHRAVSVTGDVGLFHPRRIRWLSLSAMTASTCLTVRRAPLIRFLSHHPQALHRTLEELAVQAVAVAYSLGGVAFDAIHQRVAGLVVKLAREYGEPTADGIRIGVRLSQSELAAHVAASRENVNRALSGFVAQGVISQRNGHFFVHNLAALEAVASDDTSGL